jgi:hypothetical protein
VDTIPRTHEEYRQWWRANHPHIPYGYCLCSCGQETNIADKTNRALLRFFGEPSRYLVGHQKRLQTPAYAEEDRGFETPCWIWQRSKRGGYGRTDVDGHWVEAYRVYYERRFGRVPQGYELHHRCEQPSCVRPEHLVALTRAEHVEQRTTTKLTRADVLELRRLRAQNGISYKTLGNMFGISASHACGIAKGRFWKHIPPT